MPIEFSELAEVLRTINVDYFGKRFTVTYRPDAMTPAKSAESARLRHLAAEERNGNDSSLDEAARNTEEMAALVAEVLVNWDVVRNGEALPPTKDNLMTFPNAILGHIMQAIGDDLAPKARTTRR